MGDLETTSPKELEAYLEEVDYLRKPVQDWIGDQLDEDFRLSDVRWRGMVAGLGRISRPDDDLWIEDVAVPEVRRIRAERHVPANVRDTVRSYSIDDPRYDALSEIIALEASHDPGVRNWRTRHLPAELATIEQLPETIFKLRSFPLAEREGTVLVRAKVDTSAEAAREDEERFRSGETLGPEVRGRHVRDHTHSLTYRDAEERLHAFPVASNGPLGELAAIAERLSAGYHWLADEAVAFVLTGRIPKVHPIVIHSRATDRAATSRITLRVDPRVQPETVKRAFVDARREKLFAGLADNSRALTQRASALAVFLARHQDESWRGMHALWNLEHPAWVSKDHRAFRLDAQRAWRRVVGEDFDRSKKRQRIAELRGSAFGDFPPGTLALRSR